MDDEQLEVSALLRSAKNLFDSAIAVVTETKEPEEPETASRLKDRQTWTAARLLIESAEDQLMSGRDFALSPRFTERVDTAIKLAQCDDPKQYQEDDLALQFLAHPNEYLAQSRAKLSKILSITRERNKVCRKEFVGKYGRS